MDHLEHQTPWQPNYTDLGDDRTIRFAAECVICGARYASIPVRLPSGRDADGISVDDFGQAKQTAFSIFDSAIRDLSHPCSRCHRVGCPDCWDGDHHLCGACVAETGQDRSPHAGLLTRGPLADGRLERIEPGRYSDPVRPAWLRSFLPTRPELSGMPDVPDMPDTQASQVAPAATQPDNAPAPASLRATPHAPVPSPASSVLPFQTPLPISGRQTLPSLSFAPATSSPASVTPHAMPHPMPPLLSASGGSASHTPSGSMASLAFVGGSLGAGVAAASREFGGSAAWPLSAPARTPAGVPTPETPVRQVRSARKWGVTRWLGLLLLLVGLVMVVTLITAEVSPDANAFVLRYLHVDLRAFFTLLLQLLSQLGRRLH